MKFCFLERIINKDFQLGQGKLDKADIKRVT